MGKRPLIKSLEIVLQKEITTYLHHSLPLCIILSDESLKDWFYNYYVQIYLLNDYGNNHFFLEYVDSKRVNNTYFDGLLENSYTFCEVSDSENNIINFIIEKINEGYYLIIHVDEYYLPEKKNFMKEHFVHQSLVYGYSDIDKKLMAIGFQKDRTFTNVTFDYQTFTDAYKAGKEYYEFGAPWLENGHDIQLLRFDNSVRHKNEFHYSLFLDQLNDFISSNGDRYEFLGLYESNYDVVFGMEAIYRFVEKLDIKSEGEYYIDYRAFHLLSEHKKGILKRLNYAVESLKVSSDITEHINNYSSIVNKYEELRFLVLKHLYKSQGSKTEKSFVLKIKDIILPSLEQEKATLQIIYTILDNERVTK
jgi:hypothetical protein